MEKPLRLVGVLSLIGFVAGGAFGYTQAQTISCDVFGVGLPANATCYRVFGVYLSTSVYYTLALGLAGAAIGLVLGSFIALPMMFRRDGGRGSSQHPLFVFGLPVVELAIAVPALLFLLPDPGAWPEGFRWAVAAVTLIALTLLNYGLRRRFIPR
jgi:hypothetical protein